MDSRSLFKFAYWPILWVATLLPPLLYCGTCSVSGYTGWIMIIVGLALMLYSVLLSSIGGRTLRLYGHTRETCSFWPDRLVSTGVYSCMRHPQHLGLALFPLAAALLTRNLAVVASSGWGVAGALLFVILVEEPECILKYRGEYYRYMESTPAFTLDPRCLIKGVKNIHGKSSRGD